MPEQVRSVKLLLFTELITQEFPLNMLHVIRALISHTIHFEIQTLLNPSRIEHQSVNEVKIMSMEQQYNILDLKIR